MAVTERVRIHIETSADLDGYSKTMIANTLLKRQLKQTDKLSRGYANTLETAIAYQLGQAAKAAGLFGQRLLKMNLKGFGIELAGITTGLLLMKASLATGRWIAKAWGSTINFLKASVAGLTAAVIGMVGALAAANREFSQLQMRPFAGGGTSMAAASMRGPLSHGGMQMMGMAATQQMVGTLNRAHPGFARNNGRLINQMSQAVGYDPKAAVAYAQALASSKTSGSAQPVSDFLKSQGFIYSGVAQKAAGMKAENLRGAITSGQLTPTEMGGQEGRLTNSLMGQIKGMLPRMVDLFSTIGGPLLPGLKSALRDIETIFVTALHRMTGTIHAFGLNTFIPGMVAQVQRFADWITKIVVQDLPRLMGVLRSIRDWWQEFWTKTGKWFSDLEDRMLKFEEAAATAWQMVRNVFGKFWEWYKERMHEWNDLINNNAGMYELWGDRLGNLLMGFLSMITRFRNVFFDLLPDINRFFLFLTDEVFPKLGDFAEEFAKAFKAIFPIIKGIVTALMPLLATITALVTGLNMLGGTGSAVALGLGFLGMSMRGHRGGGMFLSGMLNPVDPSKQTAQQAKSVMYQTGYRANRGRGVMIGDMNDGRVRPGVRWGRGFVSGGAMAMGTMMLAGLAGAAGGDNQITSGLSESAMMSAPLMFIPGYGMAMAGAVGGQLMVDRANKMRGAHTAGTAGAIGRGVQAGGLAAGYMAAMAPTWAAAGVAGPPGWAVAAIISLAAGAQYLVSARKGAQNQKDFEQRGVDLGILQGDTFKGDIGLESTRQGIRNQMKAYDTLAGDDSRIAALAIKNDASFADTKAAILAGQGGVTAEGLKSISKYESAMDRISEITGQTGDEVENMADRWGLALHNAADEVEYYFRLTERFKTYRDPVTGGLRGITQKDFRSNFTGMYSEAVEGGYFSETGWRPGTTTQQARQQSAASMQNLFAFLEGGGELTAGNEEARDFMKTTRDAFVAAGITGSRQGTEWAALAKPGALEAAAKEMGYDIDPAMLLPLLDEMTRVSEVGTDLTAFKKTQLGEQMNTLMKGSGLDKYDTLGERNKFMKTALESGDPEGALTLLNLDIHSEATKDAAKSLATLKDAANEAAIALGNLRPGQTVSPNHPGRSGRGGTHRPPEDNTASRSPGATHDADRIKQFDSRTWQEHLIGKPQDGWQIPFVDYWNPWG